jgi:hypothetical protein
MIVSYSARASVNFVVIRRVVIVKCFITSARQEVILKFSICVCHLIIVSEPK